MTMTELPEELSRYTLQEIHLELIRLALGEAVVQLLLEHRDLWEAAIADRIFATPHYATPLIRLPLLMKLRDLERNYHNADYLYVITVDEASQDRLIELGMGRLWDKSTVKRFDVEQSAAVLLEHSPTQRVVSVWWD